MSFIDQNLMSNERVVYRTRLHWIHFLTPAVLLLLGVLLVRDPDAGGLGSFLLALGLVFGAVRTIAYLTSEFGVTSRRVLIKTGVVRRDSVETLLTKVEGISVNQGVLGRLLGYGTITIHGTGGSRSRFKKIASALVFRQKVQEQIEGGSVPTSAGAAAIA